MPNRRNNLVEPIPLPNPDLWRQQQMDFLEGMAKKDKLKKQRKMLIGQEVLLDIDLVPKQNFEYNYNWNTGVQFEQKKPIEDENNIFINIDYTCNVLATKEINSKYGEQIVKIQDKDFIYDNKYEEEFIELYDKYYDVLYQVKKDISDK